MSGDPFNRLDPTNWRFFQSYHSWFRSYLMIIFLKVMGYVLRFFHLGSGATWPGEVFLEFYHRPLVYFIPKFKEGIIFVAGTNGKTTTTSMIVSLLEKSEGGKIVTNDTGANLLNGVI